LLLIITNEADIHPNPVIDILSLKNLPFFRLNTDRVLSDYDIYYEITNTNTYFKIKYKNQLHSIDSTQITCVWERRPTEPLSTYDHFEDENVKKIILDEADGFIKFFRYSLDNLFWIGHPIYERQAGSKILQKITAKSLGLSIPETVFTNEFSNLKLFEQREIAIKPISSFDLETKDGNIVFYTRRQNHHNLVELGENSFRNNINFLEEYIEKDYELRITVVKDECFAAKIESQQQSANTGLVDWRQGYDHGMSFTQIDIPNDLKEKCILFLKYFKLNFGCFDFIVTKHHEYVFLECNTNGQWMWLEEEASLKISSKIASVFEHEIKKNS
jgi:hypothetical protein